jgi:hypothetical protein
MSDTNAADPLAFEAPSSANPANWEMAEKQALGFAERYREKCKAHAASQRELAQTQGALDRQFGLVVRNLIATIDSCQAVLAEHPPPASVSEADGEQLASMALGKVVRAATQLLEQLGVQPVDLLGATCESVVVNGQKLEDPFEIVDRTTDGPIRTSPVTKVDAPLWVHVDGSKVRVVRKGMVTL